MPRKSSSTARPSYTPALPTSGCEMQTGQFVSTFRQQGTTAKTTSPAIVMIRTQGLYKMRTITSPRGTQYFTVNMLRRRADSENSRESRAILTTDR